jgi:hypothetical protein
MPPIELPLKPLVEKEDYIQFLTEEEMRKRLDMIGSKN